VIAILTLTLAVLWQEWADKLSAAFACMVSILIPVLGIYAAKIGEFAAHLLGLMLTIYSLCNNRLVEAAIPALCHRHRLPTGSIPDPREGTNQPQ
jgi:hypothetical protein